MRKCYSIIQIAGVLFFLFLVSSIAQAYITVSGNQSGTWLADSTYYVSANVTVQNATTLIIPKGVVVKFNTNTRLIAYGTLSADGSQGFVYFTSKNDNSVGQTITGSNGNPVQSDWNDILLSGSGSSGSVLDSCIIRYGNYGINITNSNPVIRNSTMSNHYYDGINSSSGSPTLTNNLITANRRYGIYLNNSSPVITNCQVLSNGTSGTYSAINGSNSSPTIQNCVIKDNTGSGIYITGSSNPATVSDDTVSDNNGHGIYYTGTAQVTISDNYVSGHSSTDRAGIVTSWAQVNNNVITGNRFPLVVTGNINTSYSGNTITGNTYNTAMGVLGTISGTLLKGTNLPSPLTANVIITTPTVNNGTSLIIQPGAVIKFLPAQGINVYGNLSALGETDSLIAFTSFKDDSYGGDNNADGGGTLPSSNDWNDILLSGSGSSGSVIDSCLVRYGSYGINISNSDPVIRNSTFSNSYYDGIYSSSGSPTLTNNLITANRRYGIYLNNSSSVITNCQVLSNGTSGTYTGLYGTNSSPTIQNCVIRDNTGTGIYITGSSNPATVSNDTVSDNNGHGIYYIGTAQVTISDNYVSGHSSTDRAGIVTSWAQVNNNVITGNRFPLAVTGNINTSYSGNTITGNTYNTAMGVLGTISGTLLKDTNLPSPLTANVIITTPTVNNGTSLIIQPGAVIKFLPGQGINVYGSLSAVGETDSLIAFTSFKDDSYGGDNNADGGGTLPSSNDWNDILLSGSGSSGSVIDSCLARYGYYGINISNSDPMIRNSTFSNNHYDGIYSSSGSPTLTNNLITANRRYGVYLNNSSSVITNCQILNNGTSGNYSAIWGTNSSPNIQNCVIRDNTGTGIYITGSSNPATVSDDTVSDNDGHGIYYTGTAPVTISGNYIYGHSGTDRAGIVTSWAQVNNNVITGNRFPLAVTGNINTSYSGNTITGNTYNTAMGVLGTISGTLLKGTNLPSPLTANVIITTPTVNNGTSLIIQPGSVIKFLPGQGINVYGSLSAVGKTDSLIAFTSFKDDSYGGDNNADGGGTLPSSNDWNDILLSGSGSSGSVIDSCLARYGYYGINISNSDPMIRNSTFSNSYYDGIYSSNGSPTLTNNLITVNRRYGIYLYNSSPNIYRCEITENGSSGSYHGIYCYNSSPQIRHCDILNNNDAGVYTLYGSNPVIDSCHIYGNTNFGVNNTDVGLTIDASYNWWGDSTGPYDPSTGPPDYNPDGLGNRVSDYVTYRPWMPRPYICGDTNGDDKVSLSDIVYLINFLYKKGPAPEPLEKADTNGDGNVSLSDIVYLIAYLYKLGPPPIC